MLIQSSYCIILTLPTIVCRFVVRKISCLCCALNGMISEKTHLHWDLIYIEILPLEPQPEYTVRR